MNKVEISYSRGAGMMNEGALPELPGGWVWTRLEDACIELIGGGTPSREIPDYFGGSIIWLTPTEVPKNKIVILKDSKEKITESGLKDSSARIIPKDSVLLTSRASIGYVAIAGCDVTTNQGFASFVCSDSIYNFFLAYWLWANKQMLESNATGTTFKEISKSKLREFCLPLPPLPEQRAIVSKIEQLFSDMDNGIENFKKAQVQLKIYRLAVLEKAFEGNLTKRWREQQTDLPSAEELLMQVQEEREKHYQKQLDEWKLAVNRWEYNGKEGTKPIKPTKTKELLPLKEEELKKLPELPEGWGREKLNNLTFLITDGKHGDCQNEENSGFYFISAKDINALKINYRNARQITKSDFLEVHKRTDLKPNDVLITNSGTIGRVAIAAKHENTEKTTFQKSVAIIKKYDNLIDSKYLAYHLQNDVELIKLVSKGTAQKNLLLRDIRELVISIISIQEQQQIVNEIETRLSICDKLEATITESLQKAESLRQSILKKAFEGKLLNKRELEKARNAPDWEPAEKLLERIKAEKIKAQKNTRRSKE